MYDIDTDIAWKDLHGAPPISGEAGEPSKPATEQSWESWSNGC